MLVTCICIELVPSYYGFVSCICLAYGEEVAEELTPLLGL